MAAARLHEPEAYWEKLHALRDSPTAPAGALKAIERLMPERGTQTADCAPRRGSGQPGPGAVRGAGGLARRIDRARGEGAGAIRVRVGGERRRHGADSVSAGARTRRSAAPTRSCKLQKRWIVRRLAPDCSRIELVALPKERDELKLLHAMGFETANVHLGSVAGRVLAADLKQRGRDWLYRAARAMEKAVTADFEAVTRTLALDRSAEIYGTSVRRLPQLRAQGPAAGSRISDGASRERAAGLHR